MFKTIKTGPILPAGGGMLARRKVVSQYGDQFCTHCEAEREGAPGKWDKFWGHYFDTLEEALLDYEERNLS